jgi:Ca-activated chloride channel family protein
MMVAVSRHRRNGRARWPAIALGVALVAAVAGGSAFVWLSSDEDGCTEPVTALQVTVSPDQLPVISRLADEWNADRPAGDDRCGRVTVAAAPSSAVAASLSPAWDEASAGERPDVWIPESSTWFTVAGGRPEAATMLPAEAAPSLASSPAVLAMQQPMAEALGWPDRELGWTELLGAFATGETWEQFGHPEWGPLQLGMTDPTRSTAGVATVVTVLDLDGDGTQSDQELLAALGFAKLVTASAEEAGQLLQPYAESDGEPQQLPAAFPILERDLALHVADGSGVALVPIYPREGIVVADYPYAVLQAPWVDEARREVAEQFLEHVRGPAGRQAYAEAGFRDPEHSAADVPLLSTERGFPPEIAVPVRQPTPESLAELLGVWPSLVRPNSALMVLDTSGSMTDPVPGTDLTRLELVQRSALQGLGLLNNDSRVGLWQFSTDLTPTTPYRELVPIGQVDDDLDGVSRQQAMIGAIQQLQADGGTGLYDTVYEAYVTAQEAFVPDALNMVVLITDGRDEDHDGRSLRELLADLAELVQPDRPLPIMALAVGEEADAASLEQITEVTGGRTIVTRDERLAIQQVVLAFAGRIS